MPESRDDPAFPPRYQAEDFEGEKPPCDLILKGGITSGVVYPYAITELARRHRLVSIGGTSAGAIAAGIAASAEFGRKAGGFERLALIPDDVSERLQSLFQPERRYRGAFRTFLAGLGERSAASKIARVLATALLSHPVATLLGALPGVVLAWQGLGVDLHPAAWVIVVLLLLAGPPLAVAMALGRTLLKELPKTRYGVCTGLREPGNYGPGLTEWLAEQIEVVAGRMQPGSSAPSTPLTFGALSDADVDLNVMTTNLSMRRPYRLPTDMNTFVWRPADFRALFPGWVVDYLESVSEPKPLPGLDDARRFPRPDDLPVIVAVRMSLSFPLLLCAVPLYTRDFTYTRSPDAQARARLCWFSDGGISSNFPIHFFDKLWPSRPTFAITLDAHHEDRHGPADQTDGRVTMPDSAGDGVLLPVMETRGVIAFLGAIINTAKDWQDVLQGTLSGYRERIAHVALTTDEGGLNLNMEADKVNRLSRYGWQAGRQMHGFDLDEHRWRRYLVALARIEETLHDLTVAYDDTWREFLERYPSEAGSYRQSREWQKAARANTAALMAFAATTRDDPLRTRGKIPKPDTDMRVSPRM